MSAYVWSAAKFLSRNSKDTTQRPPYALIILNQPLNRRDLLSVLWRNASLRICADGGGNRLYDSFTNDPSSRDQFIPDVIRGDLDSLRPEIQEYYRERGTLIEQLHAQDSTDFMKCVALVRERDEVHKVEHDIIALSALGGRFDQTMASIHMLFLLKGESRKVYLVSDECVTVLLDVGKHEIRLDQKIEGPTCGVVPVGVAGATLTTSGLRWNLDHYYCNFGGLISTSNLLDSDVVTIETDQPVVWTVELR
ncbi:thiamine pyrophosphokinase [Jimgerdemannia flammicorona]|uniref:Thiamine pyrophosphokinase n=1 Tax=Jimgerdemannia flammicorona TaxID=994334 RepID=A0A433D005_9FUNG|nr:thiamine pyrophosphokinase [Jimgerdemannia flammicorona]